MNKITLIVHSKSTYNYAKKIGKRYESPSLLLVTAPPYQKEYGTVGGNLKNVIGIGGGSVIDTAKIIAHPSRCIAIPTTACGSAMTPYATVWGKEKTSLQCLKPIVEKYLDKIELPEKVINSTLADALSHAIESLWSVNVTNASKWKSIKALNLIGNYYKTKEIETLILAGNYAGEAIALAKTNIIHAMSYPLTTEYKIEHGLACRVLLPHVIKFINHKFLNENFKKTLEIFKPIKLPITINPIQLAKLAMDYPKIKDINKIVTEAKMVKIYKKL